MGRSVLRPYICLGLKRRIGITKRQSKRPDPNFLDRAFSIAPQQFRNAAMVAPRVELRERVALGHSDRANARRSAVEAGRLA